MNKEILGVKDVFDLDAMTNQGYVYTTNAKLSSILANKRLTEIVLEMLDFSDKRVLDMGSGDGTYTIELFDKGKPALIQGVDVASQAIEIATKKVENRNVTFSVSNVYRLPYSDDSFDIAHLRGLLHHASNPLDIIREAFRIAPVLIILEGNGYNPMLKLFELFSPYHIQHKEKSYSPHVLEAWVNRANGYIVKRKFINLVPMFCPDWLAKLLKRIEPVVERFPPVRFFACGTYALVVKRKEK